MTRQTQSYLHFVDRNDSKLTANKLLTNYDNLLAQGSARTLSVTPAIVTIHSSKNIHCSRDAERRRKVCKLAAAA